MSSSHNASKRTHCRRPTTSQREPIVVVPQRLKGNPLSSSHNVSKGTHCRRPTTSQREPIVVSQHLKENPLSSSHNASKGTHCRLTMFHNSFIPDVIERSNNIGFDFRGIQPISFLKYKFYTLRWNQRYCLRWY